MKRMLVVAGALLLSVGAVVAQQDQVKRTQAMMKDNGKNAGALSAMVKGDKPYDQSTVNAALAQFEDTAKNLPTLFPQSMKGLKMEGDYDPSPKIWEDKTGFESQIQNFAKVVADAKSKVKNLDTLKAELPVIGKQCSSCHETYRIKKG
ncbi:cytochrome c [Bradyrhizobium sp. BWA-3-5]|jgi:cytochrome c556|uniref:c-type cytochrome n=1 Tax=Bradyrhizobium sp. BWA-3-5 TaxID=3080013 RepID=UPI00293E46FE|nr:cytochrome c [Bradyrhizobium sp. BWA-3-5]WOH68256.1 cytochrome c [Bradyrhizobium sp. BWA-3-5]